MRRNSYLRAYRFLCVTSLSLGLAGASACAPAEDDADSGDNALSAAATPGFLNGWRPGEDEATLARTWYTTTQGSHLIDYQAFLHLRTKEKDGDAKFADRANLETYGFLYPEDSVLTTFKADGLPIGMLKDQRTADMDGLPKGTYVGFTCATCHTGVVKFKGEKRFVHGGAPILDHERFMHDLGDAVHATTTDEAKKAAFCKEVADCEKVLTATNARIDDLLSRSVVPAGGDSGPGRLDAISHILNEVFGHQFKDDASVTPIQVPISVPAVWNAARLDCVQTNCLAKNSLSRNVGEVLGVFGDTERFTDASGRLRVRSTANVENLAKLEDALDWVTSPKWDAALFGEIDDAKAKRGEQLFGQNCAGCHAEPYKSKYDKQWGTNGQNWDGGGLGSAPPHDFTEEVYKGKTRWVWRVTRVAFDEVGTDPAFVVDNAVKRFSKPAQANGIADAIQIVDDKIADTIVSTVRDKAGVMGDLFGALAELHGSDRTVAEKAAVSLELPKVIAGQTGTPDNATNLVIGGKPFVGDDGLPVNMRKTDGSVMTLVLLGGTSAAAVDRFFLDKFPSDASSAAATRDKYQFFRAPPAKAPTVQDFAVYRARPLNGIAFTAPFGHAGVWPTLRTVLFPSERPASFFTGSGEFDPVNVGVDTSVKTGFEVDTTKPGSSNKGHDGTKFGTDLPEADKLAILEYLKTI